MRYSTTPRRTAASSEKFQRWTPLKVLAIKNRRLGDTVLWTASLEALHQRFTNLQLDVVCPQAYADLFAGDPRIRNRIAIPYGFSQTLAFLKRTRRENYDWALAFHSSTSTARLARWSNAGSVLIHHHGRKPRRLGSDRPILGAGSVVAAIERDLNLVRTLDWNGSAPQTKLYPNQMWHDAASARLSTAGISPHETRIVIGIGASRPAKQWPLEKYVSLARALSKQYRVIAVHENDAVLHDRVLRGQLRSCATVWHTPDLSQLVGTLSLASVYIGNDSGAKHVAAAIGVPTVTLFGPESVGEWHGYDLKRHPVVRRPVLCRFKDPEPEAFAWCGVEVCPLASHACLQTIGIEEVLVEVSNVLRESKQDLGIREPLSASNLDPAPEPTSRL